MRRRVASALSALALGAALIVTAPVTAPVQAAPPAEPAATEKTYRVRGLEPGDEKLLAQLGVGVEDVVDGMVYVKALPAQAAALRKRFKVDDVAAKVGPVDPGYTDFAELGVEVNRLVTTFPTLVSKTVIGKSHLNRDIVALKISDNVGTDESEPELLFTANQHAREHLTVEMALFLANMLVNDYTTDAAVKQMVDTREIWIVPMVNPDGAEFDIASGTYVEWRKNRQPNSGSAFIGTDLNRNWSYKFDCCGGSSDLKSSDTYHGPVAFSAPETTALKTFVLGRKVGGVQQIAMHLDIHTYSELVLWPWGYTTTAVVGPMTADTAAVHKAIGTEMADLNGYWPGQASGLYVADGIINDWMWADQKIFSFTFEMFPKRPDLADQFYPPASVIPAQTSRNRSALLRFSTYADCPYRATGKDATYCPKPDDFTLAHPPISFAVNQGSFYSLDLTATKTGGADQLVSLTATGAPPGMTVVFSQGSIPTDGSTHQVEFHAASTVTPGEYMVVVHGEGTAGTHRTLHIPVNVIGTNTNCGATNATDVAIPDDGTVVNSGITIAGCGGNGGTHARVHVQVKHTNICDLQLRLVGPGGGPGILLFDRDGADMNDIDKVFTVDLSGQPADGAWKLEAADVEIFNTGKLDSWTLTLK